MCRGPACSKVRYLQEHFDISNNFLLLRSWQRRGALSWSITIGTISRSLKRIRFGEVHKSLRVVYIAFCTRHYSMFETAYMRVDVSSLATASSNRVLRSASVVVTGRHATCVIAREGAAVWSILTTWCTSRLSHRTRWIDNAPLSSPTARMNESL